MPYRFQSNAADIMTKITKRVASDEPHKVTALVYDGLCTFEFGIAAEIFGQSRPELGRDLYSFTSTCFEDEPLTAAGGLRVSASGTLEDWQAAETLVIAGWREKNTSVPKPIKTAIRTAHQSNVRFLTICSGIYVLAESGILSGKTVTTHWRYAQHFQEQYPEITVDTNALYVQDGNIISSAGSSAGIDACLHVVRSDYGAKAANSVARRLVMHAHRQGDQAQYIERPVPISGGAHRLNTVMEDIRTNLNCGHTITSIAKNAGMSPRTFQRQFVAITGLSPMKWVIQERVNRACTLLETTDLSVEAITQAVGFGNGEALRYHFRQRLGINPVSYRNRFLQR